MAKNYANIYNDTGDSIALEQRFYLKEETTRGVFVAPTNTDFLFTLTGGSVNFDRPVISSPHRTGRHNTSGIKEKSSTEWTIPTFFNIDTTLGAAGVAEIDLAARLLHKSMYGREQTPAGPRYDSATTPAITFTLLECGDKWSKQAVGAFVESASHSFPGDGQAQTEWAGNAKDALLVGIGKSTTDNNLGNTVTLASGEGQRFPVGSYVQIIESDGVTLSADTPADNPRLVTAVAGDVITVDGAALSDADGASSDIYLTYYEPLAPTAINDPVTGLEGSLTIAGFSALGCVRSATISAANNHELLDSCYGETGLGGALFVAGGRLDVEVSLEINLNDDLIELMNKIRDDITGEDVQLILGDSSGRHLQIDLDKVIFSVPPIEVPDTGAVVITLTGLAYQSAIDAADEIVMEYK